MIAGGTTGGDLSALLAKIERRGLQVTGYKQPCLRRRIAVRMRARGVHTYDAYARVLDAQPEEYDLLVDALTITVTKFFRNPETYALLRERVVPAIVADGGSIAVWSAGCATGEEAYSLAILFREAGASRARIDATDLDANALAVLERAEYPEASLSDLPPEARARWFSAQAPYRVAPEIVRMVRPLAHDLTRDAPPQPPYRLIVCRNVVIYFDRPLQERLFRAFHDALVPGGWLLLGKVEALFGPARGLLNTEDARERLFRRSA